MLAELGIGFKFSWSERTAQKVYNQAFGRNNILCELSSLKFKLFIKIKFKINLLLSDVVVRWNMNEANEIIKLEAWQIVPKTTEP